MRADPAARLYRGELKSGVNRAHVPAHQQLPAHAVEAAWRRLDFGEGNVRGSQHVEHATPDPSYRREGRQESLDSDPACARMQRHYVQ